MNHYIQCPEGRKCRDYLDIEKIPIVHQWNKQLSCDGTYSAALCTVQMAVGMTYTKGMKQTKQKDVFYERHMDTIPIIQ